MSRMLRAVVLAVPFVLTTASMAAAQTTYPPSVGPTASVANLGGANQQAGTGGTAFTGGPGIGTGTVLMAALIVLGLTALYVGWRRAERLTDPR
jgi:hypothetical protein